MVQHGATSIVAALHGRQGRATPVGAPFAGRHRCSRIERRFATVTSLMSAPGFSRGRPFAPANPAPPPVAHAQSFRMSHHDCHSSTEACIRQVRPPTGSIVRSKQPGDAARKAAPAQRNRRRWICATTRCAGGFRALAGWLATRAPLSASPSIRCGPSPGGWRHYIRSIIALPNPEQLTCVEPGIRRAKS